MRNSGDLHSSNFGDLEEKYRHRRELALLPICEELTRFVRECLRTALRIDNISVRAKTVDSFVAKASKIEGGILKYLEDIPPEESLWRGECFVFDERVTVDHDLKRGDYVLCRACRFPVSKADQQSDKFVHGISCPRCFDLTSDEEKARFAEREKQVELAEQRGEPHIGSDVALVQAQRRQEKMRRDQL